jgi:anti-sigma B factor antagonist
MNSDNKLHNRTPANLSGGQFCPVIAAGQGLYYAHPQDDRVRQNFAADPAVALPESLQTPVAGLTVTGGQEMRETPQLPDSPSDCLPCWTTLTGGVQGQLAWSIYSDGHLVVAALDGELDLATRPGLAEQLDPLAEVGRHLILDLSGLSFCDCTGLNLFLHWQRQAAAAGGALHVVAATRQIRQLTALTGTRGLLLAGARPCHHRCCLSSHLELRSADREPS